MHLNAYRLRNAKYCKDYGVASQIFALLYCGSQPVFQNLRDYLWRGTDYQTDQYDNRADLDIETLLMLRVLDQEKRDYKDSRRPVDVPVPLCSGQARILADDIDRLLAYQNDVPRLVLIGYIKNVMALNVGVYLLKLFQIVPDLVKRGGPHPACQNCPAHTATKGNMTDCPFAAEIITDMGQDHKSQIASLARHQFETNTEQLNLYVRAHLLVKKLQEFGNDLFLQKRIDKKPESLEQILSLRTYSDVMELKTFFMGRIRNLMDTEDDATSERLLAIRNLGLNEIDTYIEMLHLLRQSFHQKYYTGLLDSLFQKNRENGLMRQGFGKTNKRRYSMGSGLLETLVQIAVLDKSPTDGTRTRHLRVDSFIGWLWERYGIHINRLPEGQEPTIIDLEALRLNVQSFKGRLRDIGFYTDLSDAYTAQVIRPRYNLESRNVQ